MGLLPARALLIGSVRLSAAGPVDAATAWERYARFALWPSWSPQVRRVETGLDRLTPGATGRVVGPLGASAGFVVTDVDEVRRRWSWTVRAGLVSIALEHGVDVADDGRGCVTWLVLRGPRPVVLGYSPLAWFAIHRLVTRRRTSGDRQVWT